MSFETLIYVGVKQQQHVHKQVLTSCLSGLSVQILRQDSLPEAERQRLLLRVLQGDGGEELLSRFLGSRLCR